VVEARKIAFDAAAFLASAGLGRRITHFKKKQPLFSQGEPADSIFYLQRGRAKLTVVSAAGKEATITLLTVGDFVGEESIAGAVGLRLATATAITACTALKIDRSELIRVLHEEHAIEFRAEVFNALNHPNLGNPGTSFGSTNFGKITTLSTGSTASREFQLAAHYTF